MNQEKIGKFIAQKRKEKGLKQSDISIKLGVSDRSVSNWERGKNMPDLSLLEPLSKILDISINELLMGEDIREDNNENYEQSVINTINYSKNKMDKLVKKISFSIVMLGLILTFVSTAIFKDNLDWSNIYLIIGIIITLIGVITVTINFKIIKKVIYILGFIFILIIAIFIFDFIGVKYNNSKPRFILNIYNGNNVILYDTPFYDAYRCYNNGKYYNVIRPNSILAANRIQDYCTK